MLKLQKNSSTRYKPKNKKQSHCSRKQKEPFLRLSNNINKQGASFKNANELFTNKRKLTKNCNKII